MPDITFFSKAQLKPGYEEYYIYEESKASRSIMLGNWCFRLTSIRPVYNIVAGGMYDFIGYEETYSNLFVSQEETDALMQRYREETGQV